LVSEAKAIQWDCAVPLPGEGVGRELLITAQQLSNQRETQTHTVSPHPHTHTLWASRQKGGVETQKGYTDLPLLHKELRASVLVRRGGLGSCLLATSEDGLSLSPLLPKESPSRQAPRTPAERRKMEVMSNPDPTMSAIPKHILDIWVIVLIILATILVMTSMVLCPATAVILYRVRTHPIRNGVV
uniref:Small integral membrane protein 3 n=2 Tax=Chelydra serpentina TaxID=8475 RepID=A0A8C3S1K3_CHESE